MLWPEISRMAGSIAAVEFLNALGMTRVEARIRHLSMRLEGDLRAMPGVEVTSPEQEELSTHIYNQPGELDDRL